MVFKTEYVYTVNETKHYFYDVPLKLKASEVLERAGFKPASKYDLELITIGKNFKDLDEIVHIRDSDYFLATETGPATVA